MKKRLIALLLATAILLSTAPAAAADSSLALQSMQSGRCGSSAAWTLNLEQAPCVSLASVLWMTLNPTKRRFLGMRIAILSKRWLWG